MYQYLNMYIQVESSQGLLNTQEKCIYHKQKLPHVHVYICDEMYPVFFFREGCVQMTTVVIVENTEIFQTFYNYIKRCIYMDSAHLSVTCSNLQHT